MRSAELKIGRTFCLAMEDGDDFFKELARFCEENKIKQAYLPGFIAGFSKVRLVGRQDAQVDDLKAPVWEVVEIINVEAIGAGTIALDGEKKFSPHIHVSVGKKFADAQAYTSHLLYAEVIFLAEMIIIEITEPILTRLPTTDSYGLNLLQFK